MIRRALFTLCIMATALLLAGSAFAQTDPFGPDISISTIPANPGPNQEVSVNISSFSVDMNSADIQWTVDGKAAGGGIGRDSFSFTTKAAGASTTVSVTVTPNGNIPIVKSFSVTPESADLLWETTDAIVPPFYRGKAMPTSESTVKFVAIPQIKADGGTLFPSNDFVYDWTEDFDQNQQASGYGKDSYVAAMDYLAPNKDVSVEASTLDGTLTADAETAITPSSPKLVLYASSPLYGPLYDMALSGTYPVSGTQASFFAEPYFLTESDPTYQTVTYDWEINGNPAPATSTPASILLQRSDKSTGTATVDVTVDNVTKLFEQLSAHLDLALQ